MNEDCLDFERFLNRHDIKFSREERRLFEEHLAICSPCREQWSAEKALDELFAESKTPRLSPSFHENLRQRITKEPSKPPLRQALMQAYWLAACIAALIILFTADYRFMQNGIMVTILITCFGVPSLLMSRILGLDVAGLILNTMHTSSNRVIDSR